MQTEHEVTAIPLAGGLVEVWCAAVRGSEEDAGVLSADELARAARLRRPADRDRFRTAWGLARRVLADRLDTAPAALTFLRRCRTCGRTGHGKPALVDGGRWEFSLSHSHGYVMLAVSDAGPVGVDIEAASEQFVDIATMVRAPWEAAATADELHWLWVRKEAVLKATGDGLAVPMTSFTLTPFTWPADSALTEPPVIADPGAPPGYRAAVAVIPTLLEPQCSR
jgi:4'-phosphopantetheinyl transferase